MPIFIQKIPSQPSWSRGFCAFIALAFNINTESGLKFYSEVVFPDGDLFQPAFYQGFIEGFKVGTLLFNVILQVVDSCNLCVSGSGVNSALLALFTELENLVGYLVVGFLVVGLFEKFLLKLQKLFVNFVSSIL